VSTRVKSGDLTIFDVQKSETGVLSEIFDNRRLFLKLPRLRLRQRICFRSRKQTISLLVLVCVDLFEGCRGLH